MFLLTTASVDGYPVKQYKGIVAAEIVFGGNVVRDMLLGLRDFFGGRSGSFEKLLADGRETALEEISNKAAALGADGVISIRIGYEVLGREGKVIMVTATGTAVDI